MASGSQAANVRVRQVGAALFEHGIDAPSSTRTSLKPEQSLSLGCGARAATAQTVHHGPNAPVQRTHSSLSRSWLGLRSATLGLLLLRPRAALHELGLCWPTLPGPPPEVSVQASHSVWVWQVKAACTERWIAVPSTRPHFTAVSAGRRAQRSTQGVAKTPL